MSAPVAWADDWKVKREDRQSIMIRRLKVMLKSKPLSGYPFRRLMTLHRSKRGRARLVAYYQAEIQRQPKAISPKVVLARILVTLGRYEKALALYRELHKLRPTWLAIALGQARCLLGLKRHTEAIAQFRLALPSIKKLSRRRSIVQQILQTALASRDATSIAFAYEEIGKLKWGRDERVSMGHLMARHGRSKDALGQFLLALGLARGGARVQLLMEVIRLQIEVGQYKEALLRIKEARKVGTLHKWLAWEILMKEIDIYRRRGQLAALVARLDRKWAKSRDYQKIILLARLYDELKVPGEAERLYLRALQRRPSEREPRMRLIKMYAKQKRPALVQKHVELLIRYKGASTRHYFLLIQEQLRLTKRPMLRRWSPSWPDVYRNVCRYATNTPKSSRWRSRYMRRLRRYQRRRYYRGGYGRYGYRNRTQTIHRCTRKSWDAYRSKRWAFWQKHTAQSPQRKALALAFRLMRLCANRFSKDWEALHELHDMFDRYGAPEDAARTFRRLVKATGAQLDQLTTMRQLLWELGKESQFKTLLLRALRERVILPKPAVALASYAFAPKKRPGYQRKVAATLSVAARAAKAQRWQSAMCPSIRRFLGRTMRRMPKDFASREPETALQMSALLWRCGERGRRLQQTLRALEHHATLQPKALQTLLQTYIRFQAKGPFERLLKHPVLSAKKNRLFGLLQQLMPAKAPPEQVKFVLERFRVELQKNPRLMGQMIVHLCRERDICQVTAPYIKMLVYRPNMPTLVLMGVLLATVRHGILVAERQRWIQYLITWQYKKKIRSLQQLVETYELFEGALALQKLHQGLLVQVLNLRMMAPELSTLWGQMITDHLRRLYPSRRGHAKDIKALEQAARRFPSLYRQVLAFYLGDYRYKRQHGEQQLKDWLSTHNRLPDLQLLAHAMRLQRSEQARFFWYKGQRAWIQALPNQVSTPESLGWLMAFAHRYRLRGLYVKSLRKLQAMRPKDRDLMRQLAIALEESPTTQAEAATHWRSWFAGQPALTTIAGIERFVASCCADRASERMAFRLIQAGIQRHGETAQWDVLFRVLNRLEAPMQKRLLAWMSSRTLTHTQFEALAKWARTHKHHAEAIGLFQALLKRHPQGNTWHKPLAILLEEEGRFAEATPHWRAYFQQKGSSSAGYFRRQAAVYQRAGNRNLAMVSMVRAAAASSTRADMAKVLRLQSQGKQLEAWATWLQTQGSQALRCLKDLKSTMPSASMVPQRLWQLNVGYTGPLLFFPRCQWLLSEEARFVLVPALVTYLNKHPSHMLTLVGSGDPNTEPDLDFLARQRADALGQALRKLGIAEGRLRISHFQGVGLCGPQTRTPHKCQAYRRQVTIATHESADSAPALSSIVVPLQQFLRADADRDGLPDYLDHCPLQHKTLHQAHSPRRRHSYSYRYRARYRSRYRGLSGLRARHSRHRSSRRYRGQKGALTYRPWSWSPQQRRQHFVARSQKASQLTGCPARPLLQIKPLQGATLSTFRQVVFASSRSAYVHHHSQGTLAQLAALLRLAPQLGPLQIHIQPRKTASSLGRPAGRGYRSSRWRFGPLIFRYGRRYRRRYRRYGGYYRQDPMKLAKKRAAALVAFLRARGVPPNQLLEHVHPPVASTSAQGGILSKTKAKAQPYLRLVFASRLTPAKTQP